MKASKEPIHIAAAFDENYLTPFYVLLTSIFINNSGNAIHLHVIATGVSQTHRQRLSKFVRDNSAEIDFYELNDEIMGRLTPANSDPRYTIAIYYRLFFSVLVSRKIEKLLYMDTDIVVIGDLLPLFQLEFDEAFAAVADNETIVREDLGLTRPGDYFNSGVLLMNLKAWRDNNISEKAIEFITELPEKCIFPDQDALNAVVSGNWKRLDPRFNLMDKYVPNLLRHQYRSYLKDKVIVHFNHLKPWDRFCQMRLKFLYRHYFKLSPVNEKGMYSHFHLTARNIIKLAAYRLEELYYNYFAIGAAKRKVV